MSVRSFLLITFILAFSFFFFSSNRICISSDWGKTSLSIVEDHFLATIFEKTWLQESCKYIARVLQYLSTTYTFFQNRGKTLLIAYVIWISIASCY